MKGISNIRGLNGLEKENRRQGRRDKRRIIKRKINKEEIERRK